MVMTVSTCSEAVVGGEGDAVECEANSQTDRETITIIAPVRGREERRREGGGEGTWEGGEYLVVL